MRTDFGKFVRRIDEVHRGGRQFEGPAVHGVYSAFARIKRNVFLGANGGEMGLF